MHPGIHAATHPDKPALVMGASGETVTFRQLDERSNRLAHLWHAAGLRPGDHVAVFMENRSAYFEVAWAALRSGLYLTTVSSYLTAEEAAYIVNDCGARALVTSATRRAVAEEIAASTPEIEHRHAVGGPVAGHADYEAALAGQSPEPLAEQPLGDFMLYSSGTTGRPKGIKRPLTGRAVEEGNPSFVPFMPDLYGLDADTVYLSPAPLYHAAPLVFSTVVQAMGGTVVAMERFDAEDALALIERHAVTHAQFVPTMFVRMLKLPEAARRRYDVSSLQLAVHAAAPCPVPVKQQMIEWWGPVLLEYYSGTEGNGVTLIHSDEWLAHPGSVGRPLGPPVHICDEAGAELPVGEEGLVYFEGAGGLPFEYHNDHDKTVGTLNPLHPAWSTLGDVGRMDDEGYLYLTDRKAFMIISGGVNIYPQEIENALVMHPSVSDVAVFGVPDDEFGEQVKAVVEPAPGIAPGPELEAELLAWCREHLAAYKRPRSVDFMDELPRLPTGKLYKRELRERYWSGRTARI
ncbi:MAG TPA: acyl-CoA synthetase [Acidimicrobiales bacterium]|nr:acyl-CoA synthetase [Acidimicrobiales bacterium]